MGIIKYKMFKEKKIYNKYMTNIEKSVGRRDYTFVAENHKNKKCVQKLPILIQMKFHILIVCMLFLNI